MSLRWRIIAFACAISVLPVVALGLGLRDFTIEQAHEEYDRQLAGSVESAQRRVTERRERERRAVERLCSSDILVDRLLLDVQAGRFGPAEHDDLVERLPGVMRSMGLAALSLLDGRHGPSYGRVLAAGQFPGRAGASDAALARAVEQQGESWFVERVHLRREGQTLEQPGLLTGCVAERGGARVIAVGGQVLDDSFVQALAADQPPLRLALTDASGELPPGISDSGGRRDVQIFEGLDGRPAARLVAAIDDEPLQARVRALERLLIGTTSAALLASVLLGLLFGMAITRPLRELEQAASRVAEGDMRSMITVRSGGEVGRALRAFNRMTEELRHAQARLIRAERIAAWRDIARRIAHEIKNPLMPIQTSIETMRKTHARKHPDFDEIFDESTSTILEEVERLKRIVTEFSQFARLPRPRPAPMQVEDVAANVVGLHASGDVEVVLRSQDPLPEVRADKEQLTQVLVNLVQNAADAARSRHGEHGGRVEVRVSPSSHGGVRIAIVDNGPGVPLEERERIFEPYYTTKSGGTGLGLAIVDRIVSDHGGSIEIEDAEDGAAFVIELTVEGPPIEAEGSQSEASAVPLMRPRS